MNIADGVMAILGDLRPENVDLEAVTITGEGPAVEIILVPHRDLGGVALILWTRENGTDLSWAQVHDLSTHDDLDMSVLVARIAHQGDWLPRLRDAIATELHRPIRLNQRRGLLGRGHIDCVVTTDRNDKRLAVLRLSTRQDSSGSELTEIVTSLASGPPLPLSIPPPLENWRRWK